MGRLCSKSGGGGFRCPNGDTCGNPNDFGLLPTDDAIIDTDYAYYGIHNFDNIAQSLLVVFQIVTAEAWSNYMYSLMDVELPFLAGFYTITLVMFGSYFLMNLILAVIIQAFINITKKELDDEVRKLTSDAEMSIDPIKLIKTIQREEKREILREKQGIKSKIWTSLRAFLAKRIAKKGSIEATHPEEFAEEKKSQPVFQDNRMSRVLFGDLLTKSKMV